MKYNKKLTIVSLILMIISLVFVVLIPAECVKLSNIIICIFTGFIVSFIISVLGYLHEKNSVLSSIYVYLSETHRRLSYSEKTTSDLLLNISDIKDFKNILEEVYVQLDKISNSKNNRIVEFYGFHKKSKLLNCLSEIFALTSTISSLIIQVSKIKQVGLQYEIFKIESKQALNNNPANKDLIEKTDADYLNSMKEMISIIYDIEKNLLTETDRLGQEIYKLYGFKIKWDDIKGKLK